MLTGRAAFGRRRRSPTRWPPSSSASRTGRRCRPRPRRASAAASALSREGSEAAGCMRSPMRGSRSGRGARSDAGVLRRRVARSRCANAGPGRAASLVIVGRGADALGACATAAAPTPKSRASRSTRPGRYRRCRSRSRRRAGGWRTCRPSRAGRALGPRPGRRDARRCRHRGRRASVLGARRLGHRVCRRREVEARGRRGRRAGSAAGRGAGRSGATWSSTGVILFVRRAGELDSGPETGGPVSTRSQGSRRGSLAVVPARRPPLSLFTCAPTVARRRVLDSSLGSQTTARPAGAISARVLRRRTICCSSGTALVFAQHFDLTRLDRRVSRFP